jgi:hypothetical protein
VYMAQPGAPPAAPAGGRNRTAKTVKLRRFDSSQQASSKAGAVHLRYLDDGDGFTFRASISSSIQRVISTSTHALAPPTLTGAGNFPALMSA